MSLEQTDARHTTTVNDDFNNAGGGGDDRDTLLQLT